ncbi:hypothetical protein TPAU25S_04181 [Tsukamurella paurometabola]|nr:Uncharacterised protein [Tsukamurella paurometabola]
MPIRAIVMILISLAILFAAIGVHGFATRDDDPQAALNAQEDKLNAQATGAAAAPAGEKGDKPVVCLIAVNRAPLGDATDRLTKAGMPPREDTDVWPARPAAPRATTVYFDEGGEDQAKTVSSVLPGSTTVARPDGLAACANSIAVAVVRK